MSYTLYIIYINLMQGLAIVPLCLHCFDIFNASKELWQLAIFTCTAGGNHCWLLCDLLLSLFHLLQMLSDVGIQTDLIPVGREVAGVVLQGWKHTNKKEMRHH